jgi:tRNA1(Val) A37 N6-methylase TrmN6
MPSDQGPTTEDAVLGGRLVLRQPRRGHRFGHDAILLAAATAGKRGEHAVDLGAGVGAAGLALARRVEGLSVTLLDVDERLVALAAGNAERNGLADRVRALALDVGASARAWHAAQLRSGSVARVLMNPPFNDPVRQKVSPEPSRRLSHATTHGTLVQWVGRARWLLAPSGVLTMIWRADGLGEVLAALARGFGAVAVLPVHPKPDEAAIRVLVRAVKDSRAPLTLLPPLMLGDEDSRPSRAAEAVLREGAVLPIAQIQPTRPRAGAA